ncbi:hypothetical protein BN3456_00077 [Clostridium sp. C105KSO13]|nr:hypothetical protein BN3456_00077 [Clostridium sp. C105KSO13]
MIGKAIVASGLTTVGGFSVFCLLYTSDAADDMQCVDLGGRRLIKKKNIGEGTVSEVRRLKRHYEKHCL